jgi:catechol 2,3-dioxygenase-like lactoylglutathione lyase family enzyme
MKFEHCAINVKDSIAVSDWYCEHCGLTAVIALNHMPFTRFLADETGHLFLEVYANPEAPVPDYSQMHHLQYHLAFSVSDAGIAKDRLLTAGCSYVEERNPAENIRLIMLRDPFGMPLQLCQRATKMS